jgi:hypothetical protein
MFSSSVKNELIRAGFIRGSAYELFVLAVSILSLINLVLLLSPIGSDANQVVFIVDRFIGLIFLFDFLLNLQSSKNRKEYFYRNFGWADMLAAVPFTSFNIFRIFRIFMLIRAIRRLGFRRVRHLMRSTLADTALYTVFFVILLLLEFGSIAVLAAEQNAFGSTITNASDALWWVFVSITTVGYGDTYPVTNVGRFIGVLVLTVGVGLFGVLTGYVAKIFLRNSSS